MAHMHVRFCAPKACSCVQDCLIQWAQGCPYARSSWAYPRWGTGAGCCWPSGSYATWQPAAPALLARRMLLGLPLGQRHRW
jgi:hypothetical protein